MYLLLHAHAHTDTRTTRAHIRRISRDTADNERGCLSPFVTAVPASMHTESLAYFGVISLSSSRSSSLSGSRLDPRRKLPLFIGLIRPSRVSRGRRDVSRLAHFVLRLTYIILDYSFSCGFLLFQKILRISQIREVYGEISAEKRRRIWTRGTIFGGAILTGRSSFGNIISTRIRDASLDITDQV